MHEGSLELRRRRDVASLFEDDAVAMPAQLLDRARTVAHEVFRLQEHSGPLRIGQRLGPYEIQGVLGAGGQAFVYEALHHETGRRVALKVPRDEVGRRLMREAELTARIDDHPHVVRIHTAGQTDDGVFYIAMELLPGGTLEDRIEGSPGGLPLDEVRRVGDAILDALDHAHGLRVLHRDIKPSNVLFDAKNLPKLGDLGVGADAAAQERGLAHSVDLTGLTGGSGLGTPSYVAPEQANPALRHGEPLDARADLYAFGKLLYAMLTGVSPTTIKPVSRVRPELDAAWDDFVFSLVEDDRERRPRSAAEVRAAFGALPASGGLPAGPGQALRRELALRTPDAPEGATPLERVRSLVDDGARPTRLLGAAALLLVLQALALGAWSVGIAYRLLPRAAIHTDPLGVLAGGALACALALLWFRRSARRTPGRPGRAFALLTAFPVCFFPTGLVVARLNDAFPHLTEHGFVEFAGGMAFLAACWTAGCWLLWRVTAGRTPRALPSATPATGAVQVPQRPRSRGTWGVVARVVLGIVSFISAGAAFVFALIVIVLASMMRGCAEVTGASTSGGISDAGQAVLLYVIPVGLLLLGILAFGSILFRRPPAD
ncbi:MAG: serine/threonine-protein kinase [Planctomycetota bacterium]